MKHNMHPAMKIYTRLLFAATRGELLALRSGAVFQAQDVVGILSDRVTKRCAIRLSERDRTVFKSVGTAQEDLASATLVYQR